MPKAVVLFDVAPIARELATGLLLLTPNQRLANRISNAYALYCAEHGQAAVAAPRVMSYEQWLQSQWQQLLYQACEPALSQRLITVDDALTLWRQILSASPKGMALLRQEATASQLQAAFTLLEQWQLSPHSEQLTSRLDASGEVIVEWFNDYAAKLSAQRLIDPSQLAAVIENAFSQQQLEREQRIALYGFERLTPAQQALLEAAGEPYSLSLPARSSQQQLVSCDNSEQELQAAAVWARQHIKANPEATIAVVVPDLSSQRQAVQRIFQTTFEPGYQLPDGERENLSFNISAGYPLAEAPVIETALGLLALAEDSIELEALEPLLHSPWLPGGDELALLSSLIKQLRRERKTVIRTARLRELAAKVAAEQAWPLSEALQQLAEYARRNPLQKKASLREWFDHMQAMLAICQWPQGRALDSHEYQEVQQWVAQLTQLAARDGFYGACTFSQALTLLQQRLQQASFQPKTQESPVQVLGLLEAAGLQFDAIWVTGMAAVLWPPAPSPNPLLPVSLQRELAMPHASAERELNYARGMSERFAHSCHQLVLSFPSVLNENPAEPSALFKHLTAISTEQLLGKPVSHLYPGNQYAQRVMAHKSLAPLIPGQAMPVGDEEDVKGGVSIFKQQAACPFAAFAAYRLAVKALDEPVYGFDGADRGTILHDALRRLWQVLGNRQTLLAMDDKAKATLCHDVALLAIEHYPGRFREGVGQRFFELEQLRLAKLLEQWLDVECQRADFTVTAVEQAQSFRYRQLTINTRIDRIDTLSDGSTLVIDYKTSASSPASWWGERPDDPQLPLYGSMISDTTTPVAGLAFAEVNSKTTAYKGVGEANCAEPLLAWNAKHATDSGAQDWPQLREHWLTVLAKLADEFIAGEAAVDPKKPPESCRFCDYQSVCRIDVKEPAL